MSHIEWRVDDADVEIKVECNTHTLTHFHLLYHVERYFALIPLAPYKAPETMRTTFSKFC